MLPAFRVTTKCTMIVLTYRFSRVKNGLRYLQNAHRLNVGNTKLRYKLKLYQKNIMNFILPFTIG